MGKPLRRSLIVLLVVPLLLGSWAGCDSGAGAGGAKLGGGSSVAPAGSEGDPQRPSSTPGDAAAAPDPAAAPGPAAAPDPAAAPGAADAGKAEPAGTLRYRFDPPFADASDVAVAERRHYRVRLVPEGEGEIPNASLVSGCDCLSAEFATPLTRDGAEVDVYIEGHQDEDIEGVLWLEGPGREQIAEHNVKILIQWKPFVYPREVELTSASRSFKIGVFVATAPGQPEIEFVFEDAPIDDSTPYGMIDYQTPEELTVDYLLRGHELTFERNSSPRSRVSV